MQLRVSALLYVYMHASLSRLPMLCNCMRDATAKFGRNLCAAITVQFEQDMYMAEESDGMVDVRVVASGRTSFEYTFTVTPMDLTATSEFN